MRPYALTQHAITRPRVGRLSGAAVLRLLNERFLWLPLGAAIAIAWANTAGESYFTVARALAFPVNEIGMALFLGLIMQEAFEAVMPGGALHTWRRWSLPIVAAVGGLAGAAFVYLGYVSWRHETVLVQAWPIACAIDIAAGYYVLKTVFRRSAAFPFLLVVGIVTNAIGVIILALWPAFTADHLGGAVLLVAAVGSAAGMRHAEVRAFWPYLVVSGTLSWLAFYRAGVHPALALLPIVPFLPHEPRSLDIFAEPPDDDAVHHAEHEWNTAAQIVLFLFGLVNAGIVLRAYDTGTWAVVAAALVGRPVGILVAVALALAAGLHLPRRMEWRDLTIVALATSSGFTFALFAAASLLPIGAVLAQIKVGALSTAAGALVTYGVARMLRVGRFDVAAIRRENPRVVSPRARTLHR
jgi:NhaA family Na+:H+ antiporter